MAKADDIIERAMARHGGEAGRRWLARVPLQVAELGGAIPKRKGLGRTHPMPRDLVVEPFARRLTFLDYPKPGREIVFDDGAIVTDGTRRENYRRTFAGWKKHRRWSPEDNAFQLVDPGEQ